MSFLQASNLFPKEGKEVARLVLETARMMLVEQLYASELQNRRKH